jgi:pimeloyl-ACP methyl ester carboxylesterase
MAPQQELVGRVYWPATATVPVPAVLWCHGISSSQDTLAPLAIALARRGIAGVVFDFGGSGRSYARRADPAANRAEAQAVLTWMGQQSRFDHTRLGIGGHSMGGTTALEVALTQPDLKSTMVLGIAGYATATEPANLLFASGVYEQLNSAPSMLQFWRAATPTAAPIGAVVGDFAQGTARQLVLSPTVEHAFAPYDPGVHRAVVDWAQQSFGLPLSPQPIRVGREMLGQGLMGIALVGLAIALYRPWGRRWPLLRWSLGGLWLGLFLIPSGLTAAIATGGGFAWLVGHDPRPQGGKGGRDLLLHGGLLVGCFLLALVLNGALTGSLAIAPTALLGLPALGKTLLVGTVYHGFHQVRHGLASPLGMGVVLGIVIAEGGWPGCFVGAIRQGGRWVGQKLQPPPQGTAPRSPQGHLWVLVALLTAVLIGVGVYQAQAGWVSGASIRFMARLTGMFVLLPGGMAIAVMRSSPWQRLIGAPPSVA